MTVVSKPMFFPSSAEFRAWLNGQCDTRRELWVGFHKKSCGKATITYPEALAQALCFGWIDGVRESVNEHAYAVRFTPRRPNSKWSRLNIRRAEALCKAGLMHASGLKAFESAHARSNPYSYEQRNQASFTAAEERKFRAHPKAWKFFESRPRYYRRTATFWVTSAKRAETRKNRLETLITDCQNGKPIKPLARAMVPKR
jgi:uncharacterized protein YdeI (YjbR/CyaY-like superfamily)